MKRLYQFVVCLWACLTMASCYNADESRQNILKVYNWADYIGEGVLEDFQQYYKEQTGEDIRIVYQTFDINEIMLTKIEKGMRILMWYVLRNISSNECCIKVCCCLSILPLHILLIT